MERIEQCKSWLAKALTDLGPILCLHRTTEAHALMGLKQAASMRVQVRIDTDGICESLNFRDAGGASCLRLCLLPDSNYWAWDRIVHRVEPEPVVLAEHGLQDQDRTFWRCVPLRLHACATMSGPTLAAAPASLSDAGASALRRIARQASGGRLAAA